MTNVHPLDLAAAAAAGPASIADLSGRRNLPLRIRGYVEDPTYDGLLADILENVADVAWPTSVPTYQQMRSDPKLAAVISGYALQLRRAQWQLNGAGCRPEVVQLVADELGLPIKGHDEPRADRTRAVSWNDHLRAALSMLVYGHAGFEIQAVVDDGRVRLAGLWERPQHTISQIHVDPKTGQFTGVSQELDVGAFDKPQIEARRMVWYAHQREGAAWFGRSLLRPAFGPWLLKREMQRVLATSSRRFGMGVPTVEWAQGATPTPQQYSEAHKAIAAARVGDQSGMALPPGAILKLVGMSGGSPPTLEFIRWLDQQMSAAALMSHLDLGQTQTGARALGETFIDAWTLALEAIGEEIADVATRQVAARLVAWNWGDDEAVPKVDVAGIGSRREITAQSLQLLLSSGALAADPELEEWVRREYRLPPRTTPRPPATPTGQPNQANQQQDDVAAAADPDLEATGTDPAGVAADHADTLTAITGRWAELAAPLVDHIAAAAGAADGPPTITALAPPPALVSPVVAAVTQAAITIAGAAADRTRDELDHQGVTVDPPALDVDELRGHATAAVDVIVTGYQSAAARITADMVGAPPADITAAVAAHLDELGHTAGATTVAAARPGGIRGWVASRLSNLLHTAAHAGRRAVLAVINRLRVPGVTYLAVEVNDTRRCARCTAVAGTRFSTLDEALAAYPTGKYRHCEGRDRCRGYLVPYLGPMRLAAARRRVWREADHPRDSRGRFRRVLSLDIATGDIDITRMSTGRLERLFEKFLSEVPPNDTALLKLNTELARREEEATDPLAGLNLAEQTEDNLFALWSAHKHRPEVVNRITAELKKRRDAANRIEDDGTFDPNVGGDEPDTPEQRRIDELVSRGYSYRDAYLDVYGEGELARQERGTRTRSRQELRAAWKELVALQYARAEQELRGHLVNPAGRARGIDPLSLFTGPAARAAKWASEDLRRWWADNPRITFDEFASGQRRRDREDVTVYATAGDATPAGDHLR